MIDLSGLFHWKADYINNTLPHIHNMTQQSGMVITSRPPPQLVDIQIMHASNLQQGTLWSVDFTPATTELSPTIFDANDDGILDVLVTQITDRQEKLEYCNPDKCSTEYGHSPCQVQIAALSGND